ncbi:MAG: dihydrodipicolinate synthase family protein [Bryobacterales bacterium]|nr:dihydrodipicolinate synthase family protein [Bryobacterales bacterium]
MNRRQLLTIASAALAARPGRAASQVSPAQFRERLTGPICSAPTVFRKDFSLDSAGFRKVLDTGVRSGCRVFTLTAGNNRYDRLAADEIRSLTRTFVEGVAGRGLTIAATGNWWTGEAVAYARYAAELGADAVQVMLPSAGDPDLLFEHFRAVAAVGPPSIVLHGQVPLPMLERLVRIDAVAAYKEEYPPLYSRDVFARFGGRLNIFAGGQKGGFLAYRPYGMKAWYSTFSTFAPEVARRFAEAEAAGDEAAMVGVIQKYDVPFFRRWSHAFWRAVLEAQGIAGRWLRPPDKSATDQEVREAAAFLKELGIGA